MCSRATAYKDDVTARPQHASAQGLAPSLMDEIDALSEREVFFSVLVLSCCLLVSFLRPLLTDNLIAGNHRHIYIYIYQLGTHPGTTTRICEPCAVASPIKRQLNNSSFIYFFCLARRPPSKPPGVSAEVEKEKEKKSNDGEPVRVCSSTRKKKQK